MSLPNILVYNLPVLYAIFEELSDDFNYKFINVKANELTKYKSILSKETLIISSKRLNFKNHILLDKKPQTIFKILEQINISILKYKFEYNTTYINTLNQNLIYTFFISSLRFESPREAMIRDLRGAKMYCFPLVLQQNRKPVRARTGSALEE